METNLPINENIDPALYELFEYKPRKGDFKKGEIIKASIECLATLGIENTTYQAIAEKIGTRRAHVAYHFQDKHDIFKSAIKYILATYQQISITNIRTQTRKEMLDSYVEAAFRWAKENPNQVSVILLHYYLCSLREDYLELNDLVKRKGQERIFFILTSKEGKDLNIEHARFLSENIQNLISQSILNSVTTKIKTLDEAKADVLKVVHTLVFGKEI